MLVEIVDDGDDPCPVGKVGRVILTNLHNFATPVIRYDIGDLAVWGGPCPAGRGLPVIERVIGRGRDRIRLPDGTRAYPVRWTAAMDQAAPIRQCQMIQRSFTEMEVKLAVPRPLSKAEEKAFLDATRDALGHPFELIPVYVDEIEREPSGKFFEFLCEMED